MRNCLTIKSPKEAMSWRTFFKDNYINTNFKKKLGKEIFCKGC